MKFSVSICVYNEDNHSYLKEALDSILNQTLQPDQIVLVVDGPIKQKLENVIINFKNQLVNLLDFKIIRLKLNKGHGDARRIGINNTKYNLVALADADDINVFDRFEKQINIFEKDNSYSIVGSQIIEIDHDSKEPLQKRIVPIEDNDIKDLMRERCPMNQMTVMFKKNDINSVGGYRDFYHNEDYYLWIRMLLGNLKFYNLHNYLVLARINKLFYHRRGGIKYFLSEYRLQKYMLVKNVIKFPRFIYNVSIRFCLQIVLTENLRALIFLKLARKKI